MMEHCKKCTDREYWLKLFNDAKLLIWLSPIQRDAFLYTFPELGNKHYTMIPSAININQFKNVGNDRVKNSVLAVNPYTFKGISNLIKYKKEHPEYTYYYCGESDRAEELTSIGFNGIGYVPNKYLNEIYNKYEYLIHLPSTIDPFCRVVAEAYLAGMKLIVNSNVGCMSYSWMKNKCEDNMKIMRYAISNSPEKFWAEIQKKL